MSFEIIVYQKEFDWKGLLLCILVTLLITSYSPKQWKQQKVSLKRKRMIQHHWSFGCSFTSPSQFQISLLVYFNATGSKTQPEFWKVRKTSVLMLARVILRKLIWKISDCSRVEWFRKSCGKRQWQLFFLSDGSLWECLPSVPGLQMLRFVFLCSSWKCVHFIPVDLEILNLNPTGSISS